MPLAFCCSTRHADFMKDFFIEAGVRAGAVHSDTTSAPRAASLERLEAGALDVIFAVDMFNEGVDLPHVDTIMMLRPTESRIVWVQQFGRGLRMVEHKTHLTVIDYIGNHRTFLLKPQVLLGLGPSPADVADALIRVEANAFDLPPGCEVTYDLRAIEILRALCRSRRTTPCEPGTRISASATGSGRAPSRRFTKTTRRARCGDRTAHGLGSSTT
jgi:hypothetical protein